MFSVTESEYVVTTGRRIRMRKRRRGRRWRVRKIPIASISVVWQ
jgi:hypothetical protein